MSSFNLPTSDNAVLEAVTAAYARFDRRADAWLEGFTREGGRVHCTRGCANCCDFPVQVSLAEALLVAVSLEDERLPMVERHARKVMRNAHASSDWNAYLSAHRERVGRCPLLDRDSGACTVYAVRPTRCRDTYSVMDAWFCGAGAMTRLTRAERAQYDREVRQSEVTDGVTHYVAPLERMSEPVWDAAGRAMRAAWGVEVWGDFWVLTTLATIDAFMRAVREGNAARAVKRASALGLWHPEIVRVA
jgi:Fe-S-cluster containining protein